MNATAPNDTEEELTPAYRAKKLLAATNELYDEADPASALTDLLADARHFADAHGLEFAKHDRLAHEHYSAEIVGFRREPEPKQSEQIAKMRNLIGIIASMKKDGEDDFVMENDDAVDTVNSLIGQARELTRQTEGGASAANKPTIGKICAACGSSDVRLNADVGWDPVAQEWNDVISLFDDASCEQCGGECDIEEVTLEGAAP